MAHHHLDTLCKPPRQISLGSYSSPRIVSLLAGFPQPRKVRNHEAVLGKSREMGSLAKRYAKNVKRIDHLQLVILLGKNSPSLAAAVTITV